MLVYYREHVCRTDPWPDSLVRTFTQLEGILRSTIR